MIEYINDIKIGKDTQETTKTTEIALKYKI